MAVIFSASSIKASDIPGEVSPFSYLFHFSEYAVLGFLALPYFSRERRPLLYCVLFCALYGLSDELHQLFVQGRTSGLDDLLTDTLGGLIGALVAGRLASR
jgi:VanZ family protein